MNDIIPSTNRISFVPGIDVGVPGGIPVRTSIAKTISSTNDTTDRTTEVNTAIRDATPNQVVLLGPGSFYINGTISYRNGLTYYNGRVLRGSGVGVTFLKFVGNTNPAIDMGNLGADWPYSTDGLLVTADAAKGATSVTIGGGIGDFVPGDFVVFSQTNVNTTVTPSAVEIDVANTKDRLKRQLCKVTSASGNTLSFTPALYSPLSASRAPQAHRTIYGNVTNIGLEDMTLDYAVGTRQVGINMTETSYSWIKNVKIVGPLNYCVLMDMSLGCEIRHCEMSMGNPGSTNQSMILVQRSSAILVEDNILHWAFPHIEINFGTSGCSFSYNYCENTDVNASLMGGSIDTNHGAHTHNNLFEGNFTNILQSDGFFGSSSDCIVARNRLHGTNELGRPTSDSQYSRCIDLNRFTRGYRLVGNILGMPQSWWTAKSGKTVVYNPNTANYSYETPVIYRFGYPNMGNQGYTDTIAPMTPPNKLWADYGKTPGPGGFQERDLDVQATTTYKGNWNGLDLGIPTGESLNGTIVADSYSYTGKPLWFGNLAWPAYEATSYTYLSLSEDACKLPAGWRAIKRDESYLTSQPTPPPVTPIPPIVTPTPPTPPPVVVPDPVPPVVVPPAPNPTPIPPPIVVPPTPVPIPTPVPTPKPQPPMSAWKKFLCRYFRICH